MRGVFTVDIVVDEVCTTFELCLVAALGREVDLLEG